MIFLQVSPDKRCHSNKVTLFINVMNEHLNFVQTKIFLYKLTDKMVFRLRLNVKVLLDVKPSLPPWTTTFSNESG